MRRVTHEGERMTDDLDFGLDLDRRMCPIKEDV
jgi:hypothetical protein